MPLAYNTPYMKKVIVLMTDGNNNWNDWTGGVPGDGRHQAHGQPTPHGLTTATRTSRLMAAC